MTTPARGPSRQDDQPGLGGPGLGKRIHTSAAQESPRATASRQARASVTERSAWRHGRGLRRVQQDGL